MISTNAQHMLSLHGRWSGAHPRIGKLMESQDPELTNLEGHQFPQNAACSRAYATHALILKLQVPSRCLHRSGTSPIHQKLFIGVGTSMFIAARAAKLLQPAAYCSQRRVVSQVSPASIAAACTAASLSFVDLN